MWIANRRVKHEAKQQRIQIIRVDVLQRRFHALMRRENGLSVVVVVSHHGRHRRSTHSISRVLRIAARKGDKAIPPAASLEKQHACFHCVKLELIALSFRDAEPRQNGTSFLARSAHSFPVCAQTRCCDASLNSRE